MSTEIINTAMPIAVTAPPNPPISDAPSMSIKSVVISYKIHRLQILITIYNIVI